MSDSSDSKKTFPLIECNGNGKKWLIDVAGAVERHLSGRQKREVFLDVSSVGGASQGGNVLVKGAIVPKPKPTMSVVLRPVDIITFKGNQIKHGGLYLVKKIKKI